MSQPRWDIFCSVIDNYGDVGVCWRLARQLAHEHGQQVRLWVDDLASLQRMCPGLDTSLALQHCKGVQVCNWAQPFPEVTPAEIVIEAFGCTLPESYIAAMAAQPRPPVWVNLEYLSAENWVEDCHGLGSPHPQLPLTKHFFFPGFTNKTGGLLRERALLTERDSHDTANLRMGLPPKQADETTVSLFCYDNAPVTGLLEAWANAATPLRCLLPEGKALVQVAGWFGQHLQAGDAATRGSLTLHVLPFVAQECYDSLLWSCDCNFVRGEDSFVRAQWAGKPMLWQIYPQQENAHEAKLAAWLDRYCSGLDAGAASALQDFHYQWNRGQAPDWDEFWQHRVPLQRHAQAWAQHLSTLADLASNLVIFCKNRV